MRHIALFAGALIALQAAYAQTPASDQRPHDTQITLATVVTGKANGPAIPDLTQQQFTVLDNNAQVPITGFRAVTGGQAPVSVILVVDGVNTSYQTVAYARGQIQSFLQANDGHLDFPTAIAVVTDTGVQIQNEFSTDGNSLSRYLDDNGPGLRIIHRSAGFYGAAERLQTSLGALRALIEKESQRPGRKLVLWLSPGWPLLSGPGIQLTAKQQQAIYAEIIGYSQAMREARVTLYSIDPVGTADFGTRTFYYQEFLKGVSKPSQVEEGDLGLQVLATQTGGLALNTNNNITGELKRCVDDAKTYYEISFRPPPSEEAHVYHHIEVKVAQPGAVARTRTGYYSQP